MILRTVTLLHWNICNEGALTDIKLHKVEQKVWSLEDVDSEFDELQSIVENIDHNTKKYNVRLHLVDVFRSCFCVLMQNL